MPKTAIIEATVKPTATPNILNIIMIVPAIIAAKTQIIVFLSIV